MLFVLHAFQRVFHFNAIALHVMATYAFTDVRDAKADVDVSEVGAAASARRLPAVHRRDARRRHRLKLVSYATVTHAVLQVLFFLVGAWVSLLGWVASRRRGARAWARTRTSSSHSAASSRWRRCSSSSPSTSRPSILASRTRRSSCARGRLPHLRRRHGGVGLPPSPAAAALPGYTTSWCGIAPQWMTRVPLATMAQYSLFWVVTIAMKWSFEYFLVIKPLALPITALWEANYRCWETGHTGSQPCIWSPDDSEALRVFRDWALRLILVTLRSAVPILLSLGDMPVFYMITLSVTSTLRGGFMKIGGLKSWPHVSTFFNTQLLFVGKCLYTDEARLDELDEAREVAEQASRRATAGQRELCGRVARVRHLVERPHPLSARTRPAQSGARRPRLRCARVRAPPPFSARATTACAR